MINFSYRYKTGTCFSQKSTQEYIDDGSHILYVNGSYKGTNPIGLLMHDFRTKKASDIHYKELSDGVRYFKENKGGQKQMCDAVIKYGDERAAQAAAIATARTTERVTARVTAKVTAKVRAKCKKEYEEKRRADLLLLVKNNMESLKLTADQAMNALKLNSRDQKILRRMMASEYPQIYRGIC